MATSYRNSTPRARNSSDEGEITNSDNSDSDADSAVWSKKRTKPNSLKDSEPIQTSLPRSKLNRSKNANIWGSVLTQQSSDDISSSLCVVGMRSHISRGPESFDLPSNFNNDQTEEHSASNDSSDDEPQKMMEQTKKPESTKRSQKRKKPKKSNNVPTFKPGQEVALNKRADLSDTDPVDKVSEEIAFRLWERKKVLIRAITEVIGVPTAIDFCNKTEQVEKSGGLMTLNGRRRRTPGGTFLHLIRNDSRLDQEPINKVFALEAERDKLLWELRKQSKKKTTEQINNNCEMVELSAERDSKTKEEEQCENATKTPVDSVSNGEHVTQSTDPTLQGNETRELSDGEIMDSGEEAEAFG